jgi:hypothetical protein
MILESTELLPFGVAGIDLPTTSHNGDQTGTVIGCPETFWPAQCTQLLRLGPMLRYASGDAALPSAAVDAKATAQEHPASVMTR